MESYEPKSPDEEVIVSVFKELDKTWGDKDIEGHIAFYHDDAKIMVSKGRMLNKTEYKKVLTDYIERFPGGGYLEPTFIDISGNKASVKIGIIMTNGREKRIYETYNFVKENSQWLIIKSTY